MPICTNHLEFNMTGTATKTKERRTRFSDYVPVSSVKEPEVIVPCIATGDFGRAVYEMTVNYIQRNFGENSVMLENITLNNEGTIIGSRFPFINIAGQLVRKKNSRFDLVSHSHLTDSGIANLTEDEKIYIEAQDALVLRPTDEFWDERDKPIFNQLKDVLSHQGDNLETPALLTGLRVRKATQKEIERYGEGYGYSIVPVKGQFTFTHDESQFGGEGGWYESDYAFSGLYRYDAYLGAHGYLVDLNRSGRVGIVSAEGTAPKK